MTKKRPPKRWVIRAHERAATLGEIIPVEPDRHTADGSPQLRYGQVFVTRTGVVFHRRWCEVAGNLWDERPDDALIVIAERTAGKRRPCLLCEAP